MRTGLPVGTGLLTLLLLGGAVGAQEFRPPPRAPVPVTPGPPPPAAPVLIAPVPPPPAAPVPLDGVAPGGEREALLSLDIMLGQQMGIRPQVAVYRADHLAVVAEGFYGALLTKLGTSEGAGAGARVLYRRGAEGSTNSLVFGPGVDVLFQFNDDAVVMLAPTVDLAWLHGFGDRGGWETGINAGIGVGLSGQTHHDKDAAGQVTPLISVYTGFRY